LFNGIKIKIRLNQRDLDNIIDKLEQNETEEFVEEDQAYEWVKRCVEGDITREDL
jgi:hypothetical protein